MRDRQPDYNKGYFIDGPYLRYDYAEITISGGVVNHDVKNNDGLFTALVQGKYLEVSASGSGVTMKMNGSGNAPIPIVDGESRIVDYFLFTNLYFTNDTGTDAVVSLYMMGHR